MQNDRSESFASWRTTSSLRPRLNSGVCFICIHLLQITRFTRTTKPEFKTPFYWFWIYVLLYSRSLNFTMSSSMLCSLSFDSTSENFEFRWSVIGRSDLESLVCFIVLSVAKCRFWRISQKRFRIIVFWIPSLPIRLSTLQYSAIVGNLLIAITKFIPRNAFSSSLVTVKFLPFWWAWRFDFSAINSSSSSRPVTKGKFSIGETVSFRLGCISGTRWHSSCLVTFSFLVHFRNSSFFVLFFLFWLIVTWYYEKIISLWCIISLCVLVVCVIFSSAMNSVSESFIKLSMSSSSALYII